VLRAQSRSGSVSLDQIPNLSDYPALEVVKRGSILKENLNILLESALFKKKTAVSL
jgi:hypothetical protein